MRDWVRKDLQLFTPYHSPVKPCRVKLDANESPFLMPDRVKARFVEWLTEDENLQVYPDTDCIALRDRLALFWNVARENIVCGVGSDQLIDYITKVFLEPDEAVLVLNPTFSMYAIATVINRGRVVEVALGNEYAVDVDEIVQTANRENVKILFLCTPNNPTGGTIELKKILTVAERLDCIVVVDEAYAEFSGETVIPYLETYRNVIVLRTFSKAYGLAGARIGYAIASEELCEAIDLVKAPYNLNTMSQQLAIFALEEHEEYKRRVCILQNERERLLEKLREFPFLTVVQSSANFIFMESTQPLADRLAAEGVLIRTFTKNGAETIRLTVGTPDQNTIVLALLSAYNE